MGKVFWYCLGTCIKLSRRYIASLRVKPHPSPPLGRGGSLCFLRHTGENQGENAPPPAKGEAGRGLPYFRLFNRFYFMHVPY